MRHFRLFEVNFRVSTEWRIRDSSPPLARKRRTREHVIADLSINHVERQALLAGYTVNEWLSDYGIDLVLSTYTEEGETESGIIFLQVKATDRPHYRS